MSTEVKIAEFKSHLSEHLRAVRRGHEIIVKDRETPIARVVPYEEPRRQLLRQLIVKHPTRSLQEVDRLPGIRPKKLKPGDLEEALRATKMDWFDKWMSEEST